MAILSVRNLPDDVHRGLRLRAARHGRSMEAEAREILEAAVREGHPPTEQVPDLPGWIDRIYGDRKPGQVVEDLIRDRHAEGLRE